MQPSFKTCRAHACAILCWLRPGSVRGLGLFGRNRQSLSRSMLQLCQRPPCIVWMPGVCQDLHSISQLSQGIHCRVMHMEASSMLRLKSIKCCHDDHFGI